MSAKSSRCQAHGRQRETKVRTFFIGSGHHVISRGRRRSPASDEKPSPDADSAAVTVQGVSAWKALSGRCLAD